MNCLKKIIVVGLAGLLLSMCGSDNAAEFEIKDNAGTIERNDPRIDALIPADANI